MQAFGKLMASPGGWGMDLRFRCPEPLVAQKEQPSQPGLLGWIAWRALGRR